MMSDSLKFMMSDTWPGGLTIRGDGLTGGICLLWCAWLLELSAAIALQNARERSKPKDSWDLIYEFRFKKHWLSIPWGEINKEFVSSGQVRNSGGRLYSEISDPYRTPAIKEVIARSNKKKGLASLTHMIALAGYWSCLLNCYTV